MKKIGVFTSGGDAPGMNACVRAVVRTAIYHGVEVMGIQYGYEGMIKGDFIPMRSQDVANIIQRGGTVLKSSRSAEFRTPEGRQKALAQLRKSGIEGLVCIGGDGTFTGAAIFHEETGIPSIGVPGTIDNDLSGTDFTIGFDTAVNTALDAIDRLRDTADSHDRIFFVEVMGRDTGFIAMEVGISGGAEAILIPEVENQMEFLVNQFRNEDRRKKRFSIVVVAEGDEEGNAYELAKKMKTHFPDLEYRVSVLGHIQRGGKPTAADRVLASRLGFAAVEQLLKGNTDAMVGVINDEIVLTPFKESINNKKPQRPGLVELAKILSL